MSITSEKHPPGVVRDAILTYLSSHHTGASLADIHREVESSLGPTSASSIRSYLRLNAATVFDRVDRGRYRLRETSRVSEDGANYHVANLRFDPHVPIRRSFPSVQLGGARLFHGDCLDWLHAQPPQSIHAVVTDPPYGLVEYSEKEKLKLRQGKGGVWRIPPSFDGNQRAPLPRFTTLRAFEKRALVDFFRSWGEALYPVLVPGSNLVVASNPLLSFLVAVALTEAGFERRGEIIRLTMTMRGGDRPKAAHTEFNEVSVMPRSMWEPWLLFRKPLEGRAQDNLRKWGTGGFRRPSGNSPFGDVIRSAPTRKAERQIAPHPSLKPQAFMRQLVKAVLPLGKGVILDPFAGSGSTLAAAEAVGYESIGVEADPIYFQMAGSAIRPLSALRCPAQRDLELAG